MVANVIRLYDRLRDVTGLKFNAILFKGGICIRLVLLEFFNDLPLEARLKITEYMTEQKALSLISDFDFEIVLTIITQKMTQCIDFSYWITQCSCGCKSHAKKWTHTAGGLLFLDWNEEEGRKELKEYLQNEVDELDKESPLHDANDDYVFLGDTVDKVPKGYQTKSDEGISPPRKMHSYLIVTIPSAMQANKAFQEFDERCSRHIGWEQILCHSQHVHCEEKEEDKAARSEYLRGVFHLARIKHSFVIYYTTKTGKKVLRSSRR